MCVHHYFLSLPSLFPPIPLTSLSLSLTHSRWVIRNYLVAKYKDKPLEFWDAKSLTFMRELVSNPPTFSCVVSPFYLYTPPHSLFICPNPVLYIKILFSIPQSCSPNLILHTPILFSKSYSPYPNPVLQILFSIPSHIHSHTPSAPTDQIRSGTQHTERARHTRWTLTTSCPWTLTSPWGPERSRFTRRERY